MTKILSLLTLLFLSKILTGQSERMRNNEFGIHLFTAYDFDQFSIINRHKLNPENIPVNIGIGLSYNRLLKNNFLIIFNFYNWTPFTYPPKPTTQSILKKYAFIWKLGMGKRYYLNKHFMLDLNSQLVFRKGHLNSISGGGSDWLTHRYFDFGLSLGSSIHLKISRFLSFSTSANYVFYFIKKDKEERVFFDSPFVTRHSLMLNTGFTFRF